MFSYGILIVMSEEIRISVRTLVEFLFRSGDIDNTVGLGASEEVMREGARMHKKMQSEEGDEYTAEVPLIYYHPISSRGDAYIVLEGRADGIYFGSNPEFPLAGEAWTIDEIKTTYAELKNLKEPVQVHLAQALCYAYIFSVQNHLDIVRVRMTYCNLATEDRKYFYYERTGAEIEEWFGALMKEYEKWACMQLLWREVRTKSLQSLVFPYEYREGQRDLAVYVYRTIVHGKKLFLEAPTGTGKTLSVLFPSLKAVGEGKADKIFYMTAKNVTAEVPAAAVGEMRDGQNLHLKSVQIIAKDKICPLEKAVCNPKGCERAAGHFDRVNDALYELLTEEENYSKDVIIACAQKYKVCPFELSLDLSLFSDMVIGDYNYLFDPHARLKRFFVGGTGAKEYIFLVDEAHNLVDRGREMFSANLYVDQISAFQDAVKKVYPTLHKRLGMLREAVLSTDEGGVHEMEDIGPVADEVSAVNITMEQILSRQRKTGKKLSAEKMKVREVFMDFYFVIRHFLQMYEASDGDYIFYSERVGDDFKICLYCVDPSVQLSECLQKGTASVLFSATFLPVQYYKRLLGGDESDFEVYAHSIFDSEKRGLFVVGDVTSRYRDRNEEQFRKIARCIHSAVSARHGNYMVFFPSYLFMESVLAFYLKEFPENTETAYLIQRSTMNEAERESFLQRFDQYKDDRSLIGFGVLGGVFSEGIDLRNDRLIGVLIVGTGLPQVGTERELLKSYFDARGESGFDYAYTIPGMNKVLQAAGRVIRTEEDVGIVGLLDGRFLQYGYRKMFPAEWKNYRITASEEIGEKISRFWDEWL